MQKSHTASIFVRKQWPKASGLGFGGCERLGSSVRVVEVGYKGLELRLSLGLQTSGKLHITERRALNLSRPSSWDG